jgi:hypothetical protein
MRITLLVLLSFIASIGQAQDTCDYNQYFKSFDFNFQIPKGWKMFNCLIDPTGGISTLNFVPIDSNSLEKYIQVFVMSRDGKEKKNFYRELAKKDSLRHALDEEDALKFAPLQQFRKDYPIYFDEEKCARVFGLFSLEEPITNTLCTRSVQYIGKDWSVNVRYSCLLKDYKTEFRFFDDAAKNFGFIEAKKL